MHNESPPIILSNYRDSNLFQTAVLGQVKERQFIQIDLRIPLKKKRTRLTHKGRVHDLPLDLVVALFSYSHRKGKHRKTMGETTFPWTWRKGYLFFHTYWWSIIHVYLFLIHFWGIQHQNTQKQITCLGPTGAASQREATESRAVVSVSLCTCIIRSYSRHHQRRERQETHNRPITTHLSTHFLHVNFTAVNMKPIPDSLLVELATPQAKWIQAPP